MKPYLFLIAGLLFWNVLLGQRDETGFKTDSCFVFDSDTIHGLYSDYNLQDGAFTQYIVFTPPFDKSVNLFGEAGVIVYHPLITGQFLNGKKTGIWHYNRKTLMDYRNGNSCGSGQSVVLKFSKDTVSYTIATHSFRTQIHYVNDSSIIYGEMGYDLHDEISFFCELGCQFINKKTKEILFEGLIEDFDFLLLKAEMDYAPFMEQIH